MAARCSIWLPALSYAEWSELSPYIQSLANLTSLHVEGREVGGEVVLIKTFGAMEAKVFLIETTRGGQDSPLTQAFLVGQPEWKAT